MALSEAVEAAFALGTLDKVRSLLSIIDDLAAGDTTPFQRAQRQRFGARLAGVEGEHEAVEPGYRGAAKLFREIGTPFWLADTLLEHGEWLTGQGRTEEARPLLEEAGGIFERLQARPWLERLEKIGGRAEAVTPG
jgi:hypothetical protein